MHQLHTQINPEIETIAYGNLYMHVLLLIQEETLGSF